MVKVGTNDNKYFQCEECGFKYQEKEWAEKCEAWCQEYHACNLEIIKHAIQQLEDSNSKSHVGSH